MICPNCQYESQEHDTDMPHGVCTACGIAYAIWSTESKENNSESFALEFKEPLMQRLYYDALVEWTKFHRCFTIYC